MEIISKNSLSSVSLRLYFLENFIEVLSSLYSSISEDCMKKTLTLAFFLVSCFVSRIVAQTPVPAREQVKPIFLVGATIHTGAGRVIENGVIGFDKGKITHIGDIRSVQVPVDTMQGTVIKADGKHIYPGFIAANTTLGLTEIEAARATRDFSEVGSINPHVRALIAYNTDSKILPTIRFNGVLIAQATPQGGLISGQSALMYLEGWNWEDAVCKSDDGIWMNWPNVQISRYNPLPVEEQAKRAEKALSEAKMYFREARAYAQSPAVGEKNLKFEAMRGLFSGEKKLFIRAYDAKSILAAVAFGKEFGLRVVIVGGYDSWRVADVLHDNEIPVILSETHRLPARADEDVNLPYKLPALLQKAGVTFCIAGDGGSWQQRNIMFQAGTAAAWGLSKEEALSAVTLSVATILGIGDRTGSLEIGKEANLFVSPGDALDMRTNAAEMAFIRGKKLDMQNFQKDLFERYKTKYGLKNRK